MNYEFQLYPLIHSSQYRPELVRQLYKPELYPMPMPEEPTEENKVEGEISWELKCHVIRQGNQIEYFKRLKETQKIVRLLQSSKKFHANRGACDYAYCYPRPVHIPPTYEESMGYRENLSLEEAKKMSRKGAYFSRCNLQHTLDGVWALNPKTNKDVYDLLYGKLTCDNMSRALKKEPLVIKEGIQSDLVNTQEKRQELLKYLNNKIYYKYKLAQLKQSPRTLWYLTRMLCLIIRYRKSLNEKIITKVKKALNQKQSQKKLSEFQNDLCIAVLTSYHQKYCTKV